jgi:hypothetical protein
VGSCALLQHLWQCCQQKRCMLAGSSIGSQLLWCRGARTERRQLHRCQQQPLHLHQAVLLLAVGK